MQWIDPAAFAPAPEGRRGNSTRGQVRGPSYQVWDISLRKQFRVSGDDAAAGSRPTSSTRFNHVNWGNPATNLAGAGFGTITSITGQPRNIQLGARIMF